MEWSKLKKAIEFRMADSLQKRVGFCMTHYGPGHSFGMVRGWITFDKVEIFNSSNAKWWGEHYKITSAVRKMNHATGYSTPQERVEYHRAADEANAILEKREILSQDHYINSLKEYLDLSLDDAMASTDVLIRAIAMFDRRLGKRRLPALTAADFSSPLVTKFYTIRMQAEDLESPISSFQSQIINHKSNI